MKKAKKVPIDIKPLPVKKPAKPIQTYKAFFRALNRARKGGRIQFFFEATSICIRNQDGDGFVYSHVPGYCLRPGVSSQSPFHCVYYDQFWPGPPHGLSVISTDAASLIGLRTYKLMELLMAWRESPQHDPKLRERLLKACGLIEVPHSQRKQVTPYEGYESRDEYTHRTGRYPVDTNLKPKGKS